MVDEIDMRLWCQIAPESCIIESTGQVYDIDKLFRDLLTYGLDESPSSAKSAKKAEDDNGKSPLKRKVTMSIISVH